MPRLPPSLLRKSYRISPHIRTLLPATRDLTSAGHELRWIREHIRATPSPSSSPSPSQRLARLCRRRGRGEPLQYVLSTQPFGSLDLQCRPGVLIPRPETEALAAHLEDLLRQGALGIPRDAGRELRIVDFCTGTGCIALSLFAGLQRSTPKLVVRGVDVSPVAVGLARENLHSNVGAGRIAAAGPNQSIDFALADVFDDGAIDELAVEAGSHGWDVLVSNPPYVSRDVWAHGRGQMGYSVRKYEPKLALVPGEDVPAYEGCAHEDVFYARLLDVAVRLGVRVVLFELGDEGQAARVLRLVRQRKGLKGAACEVWRDWPDLAPQEGEDTSMRIDGKGLEVAVKGSGNVRSVLVQLRYPS
ncbi:hypothetical protein ACHAQA_008272 [Verticillium albo-atrum]